MAQISNIEYIKENKGIIHDLIRLPDDATKEKLVCALYKSIRKAYLIFQYDLQKNLVNDKGKNWKGVNLENFNDIEELLRQREVWASCASR